MSNLFDTHRSLYVDETSASTAQDCLEACRGGNAACNFFTFYPSDAICVMFETCPDFSSVGCEDCVSGRADCPDLQCGVTGKR